VELDPPLKIHYRHRSGPSRGLAETIEVKPIDASRSRVIYVAAYPSRHRWCRPKAELPRGKERARA
jgi:hypothetical protein